MCGGSAGLGGALLFLHLSFLGNLLWTPVAEGAGPLWIEASETTLESQGE